MPGTRLQHFFSCTPRSLGERQLQASHSVTELRSDPHWRNVNYVLSNQLCQQRSLVLTEPLHLIRDTLCEGLQSEDRGREASQEHACLWPVQKKNPEIKNAAKMVSQRKKMKERRKDEERKKRMLERRKEKIKKDLRKGEPLSCFRLV